jgi:hypothetical protein
VSEKNTALSSFHFDVAIFNDQAIRVLSTDDSVAKPRPISFVCSLNFQISNCDVGTISNIDDWASSVLTIQRCPKVSRSFNRDIVGFDSQFPHVERARIESNGASSPCIANSILNLGFVHAGCDHRLCEGKRSQDRHNQVCEKDGKGCLSVHCHGPYEVWLAVRRVLWAWRSCWSFHSDSFGDSANSIASFVQSWNKTKGWFE